VAYFRRIEREGARPTGRQSTTGQFMVDGNGLLCFIFTMMTIDAVLHRLERVPGGAYNEKSVFTLYP